VPRPRSSGDAEGQGGARHSEQNATVYSCRLRDVPRPHVDNKHLDTTPPPHEASTENGAVLHMMGYQRCLVLWLVVFVFLLVACTAGLLLSGQQWHSGVSIREPRILIAATLL
jgi:hypothetical protein